MKKVFCGNVYIFPAQRMRITRGICHGQEGYLIGWMPTEKDKRTRCVLMVDEAPGRWSGKIDFPMEIVRPIPKTTDISSNGSAA